MVPGVVLVFFGMAAWFVALLAWSGLVGDTTMQLLVFVIASPLLLFGLRRYVKGWFVGDSDKNNQDMLEEFLGREVKVLADIPGGQATGKVELKGAEWRARSGTAISRGCLARVTERDGLVLIVQPLQNP